MRVYFRQVMANANVVNVSVTKAMRERRVTVQYLMWPARHKEPCVTTVARVYVTSANAKGNTRGLTAKNVLHVKPLVSNQRM